MVGHMYVNILIRCIGHAANLSTGTRGIERGREREHFNLCCSLSTLHFDRRQAFQSMAQGHELHTKMVDELLLCQQQIHPSCRPVRRAYATVGPL